METPKPTSGSLNHALNNAAIHRVARTKPEDMLADLKKQGVHSLEELVQKTLEVARATASNASAALDDEVLPYCYKFTSYRPHFSEQDISEIVNLANKTVYR
jgi:hypothetical protein